MLAVLAEHSFDASALLVHSRARLGLWARRKILMLPTLPHNAQGKVMRRALVEQAAGPPA